jgi:hypothetical protein
MDGRLPGLCGLPSLRRLAAQVKNPKRSQLASVREQITFDISNAFE